MKHVRALLVKFVMVTAMLLLVLGVLYGVSFGDILTISLFLTLAAYLIGDLFVLPGFGNTAATIADFGLAFLGTLLVGAMVIEEPIRLGVASFLSALLIAVGEVFFHRYVERAVIQSNEGTSRNRQFQPSYQTEFAEENYPEVGKAKKNAKKEDNEFSEDLFPPMATNSTNTVQNQPYLNATTIGTLNQTNSTDLTDTATLSTNNTSTTQKETKTETNTQTDRVESTHDWVNYTEEYGMMKDEDKSNKDSQQ